LHVGRLLQWVLVEHDHLVAGPRQQERREQPRGAPADDGDVQIPFRVSVTQRRTWPALEKPTSRSTGRPPENRIRVGRLRTVYRTLTSGSRSESSRQTASRPSREVASSATTGSIIRQGGHQSAENSTRTGPAACRTTVAKVSVSTSRIALVCMLGG